MISIIRISMKIGARDDVPFVVEETESAERGKILTGHWPDRDEPQSVGNHPVSALSNDTGAHRSIETVVDSAEPFSSTMSPNSRGYDDNGHGGIRG